MSPAWSHYRERLRPQFQASGYAHLGRLVSDRFGSRDRPVEVLCLGCEDGFEALALATSLGPRGSVRCLDREEGRFAEARDRARQRGLPVAFEEVDLGAIELDPERFDLVVMRDLSRRLEHPGRLLRQIARGLGADGLFHLEDCAGQNARLLWEENEWFANALLERLPEPLTGGQRIELAPEGAGSPHQEEVDETLRAAFEALFEHRHGAFMRFVCAQPELGQRLGANSAAARNGLDFLIDSDDSAVRHELLRPLEIWGVYRTRGSSR